MVRNTCEIFAVVAVKLVGGGVSTTKTEVGCGEAQAKQRKMSDGISVTYP